MSTNPTECIKSPPSVFVSVKSGVCNLSIKKNKITESGSPAEWLKDDSREHFKAFCFFYSLSHTRDIFFSPRNWYSNRNVSKSMALTNTIQLFLKKNLRCCPVAQNKNCVFVCTRSNHVILIPEYKAAIVALYSFQNYLNFLTQIECVFNGQFTKYNHIYIYEYTTRSTCWFSSQWYFLNAPE